MLWSGLALRKRQLQATDGALGEIEDLLFDDRSWAVRHVVVDTGRWLPGRKVLIPPASMGQPREKRHDIPISLSRQQIKDSPPVERDEPISLRMEEEIHRWYGWAPNFGGHAGPIELTPGMVSTVPEDPTISEGGGPSSHLRSINEVRGYQVFASDGCAGLVNHFEIDDQAWVLRYIVFDTCGSIAGKLAVAAVTWVKDISWSDKTITMDVRRKQIEQSAEFDPAQGMDNAFERSLHDHYSRWSEV